MEKQFLDNEYSDTRNVGIKWICRNNLRFFKPRMFMFFIAYVTNINIVQNLTKYCLQFCTCPK